VPDDGTLADLVAGISNGATITIKAGVHVVSKPIVANANGVKLVGEPGAILQGDSELGGGALLEVHGTNWTVEGLVFDGQFSKAKGIRGRRTSSGLTIRNCELKHLSNHAIDLDGADSRVEECQIHDNLVMTDGKRDDAHGIVTLHASNLVIRKCRIWNCSGDAIQAERGSWQNLLIDDCDLFLEPLAEAGAGFPKGDYVGENALDTKRLAKHERGKIRVVNCRAWGFKNERPGDWAAFNIKEKVHVEVVECDVRDSQIAFRLPTYRKGDQMQCEIKDCVIRDCATAFRIEDQAIGKEGKPGGTKIVGCRIENCKTGVDFVGVRAEGPLGKIGFKPESSMTDCVFVPELTVNIARATNKDYRALLAHLLEQGNREETTDAEPHESAEAAEGSSDDDAPRHTPRGKE